MDAEISDKRYESIDAAAELRFHGHHDILNKCFGVGIKKYGHQKGRWQRDEDDDWFVWMPKILCDRYGRPKASSSGWTNSISQDRTIIKEYTEDQDTMEKYPIEKLDENYIRLVFVYDNSKDYIFRGAFQCDKNESAVNKRIYKRIATKVKLIGNPVHTIELMDDINHKIIEPLDDMHSLEEKEEQARFMDEESLKAAARLRSGNSKTEREVVVKQIVRDPYISEYAKLRAKGVCQLCGEDAPFKDSKGRPYLESHHIIWLANGGEDSIENTVALCPNCHRKMHIVMDEKDVETLKNITRE